MNNDLINREALLDAMCKTCTMQEVCEKSYNETRDFIQAIPAVDAEPVRHGRIIETIENGKFKRIFSCCGKNFTTMTTWMTPRYCPNCGAKMDGE